MKIFLNLLAATTGGQLSRARAYLDRFETFSLKDQLVVVKDKSVLCEYTSTKRMQVVDVAIGSGNFRALKRVAWENIFMPRLIRSSKAEVFLTFSHYIPPLWKVDIPTVVGVSNLAPFYPETFECEAWSMFLKMRLLKHTLLSSCSRATHVLALSQTCKQVLCKNGIDDAKISITPNGVDDFWRQDLPKSALFPRLGIRGNFLLSVSHFYSYKNYRRLVHAYNLLPKDMRESYQLVLVGQSSNRRYFDEVHALIKHFNLREQVIIVPGENAENLRELYQNTSLFIFPSLIENSPNILLEAMMAGSALAVSDRQPMPEFGGRAVAYFDPLDIDSMSTTIAKLLNNKNRLKELKQLSRQQAELFSWDSFFSNVNRVCLSLSDLRQ